MSKNKSDIVLSENACFSNKMPWTQIYTNTGQIEVKICNNKNTHKRKRNISATGIKKIYHKTITGSNKQMYNK